MSEPDSPRVFLPPPLLFATAAAAGLAIDGNTLDWALVGRPARFAGLAVALAGLALILLSLGLFRRFRTRPEPWQPSSALITSGLYRLSRNPMYLGMAALAAGFAIYFESLASAALLALVVAGIDRFVIQREECYLSRRFGADYDTYRARVRRWL